MKLIMKSLHPIFSKRHSSCPYSKDYGNNHPIFTQEVMLLSNSNKNVKKKAESIKETNVNNDKYVNLGSEPISNEESYIKSIKGD